MSILVVQIPQRQRLQARSSGGADSSGTQQQQPRADYAYAVSPDGLTLQNQGRSTARLLPKATSVVAVLADADVAWHRITLPKAPAARLRAALDGVLEEALLEDTADVHLALAPRAVAGQPTWVAAVDRQWLIDELAALEKAEVFVGRVVPASWPDDPPAGHFAEVAGADDGSSHGVVLHWAHADGVASVRLKGGLARALVPTPAPPGTRWSATPGAAATAEQWLGAPVGVLTAPERLLRAARSLWNLRQFDLGRRTRGGRAAAHSWREFLSPAWRPVRWGVAALVVVQLAGLNLWAWRQRDAVEARRAALQTLVRTTYPKASPLDIQRDADTVMQRESQALRTLAGKPGDSDLETMLQAAAAAWPPGRPPVDELKFEPGKLTLVTGGWAEPEVERFRGSLRPDGWQIEALDGRSITLSRAPAGGRNPS